MWGGHVALAFGRAGTSMSLGRIPKDVSEKLQDQNFEFMDEFRGPASMQPWVSFQT